LSLQPLERDDVAAYIAQATGSEPSGDRVDQLYEKTEGNPLFLRELLQLRSSQPELSEGIRAVIRARAALLSSESRAVLEAAAVLGREFAAAPLAVVAGVSELEVRALMESAIFGGIVETIDDPPRWRFTHALMRQGLYDDIPPDRRAALHRAFALELRERRGGPPLSELAHHLECAIPAVAPIEAAQAALRAAEHAVRQRSAHAPRCRSDSVKRSAASRTSCRSSAGISSKPFARVFSAATSPTGGGAEAPYQAGVTFLRRIRC